ncbi:No apical meristem (NAM) protein [Musa troglodytarum]|uniref:No apical meristem (NAM) protein n=1 Tax=Musa troglodytarum TaxID=320322 RepID=A0A9E7HL74_9LILI|nr:No apical meristem (NAM) protein [Musa troglodytarum]
MTSPTLTLYSRLSSAPFSSSSSLVSSPEPENSAVHGARRPRPERLQVPSTAEELVVDYLANWVAGAPLPARAVAFADVYGTEPWNLLGSGRQEGFFFAERKPKSSGGSRVDRKAGTGSWVLNKKQEAVNSIVGGREMVVGRKSYLSFNDGRRKNSGWCMYEYEMISSGFQRRVLCHVKKNSHTAVSGGGTTTKTVDSSIFTEAVSVTEAISGGSLRNREESSALSAAISGGSLRNREESSALSAVSVTEAISGGTTINGGREETTLSAVSVAEAISGGSLRNREESSALSAVSVTEAISGGTTINGGREESSTLSAVSVTCVGQKRNREESSTLSAVSVTEAISGGTTINGGTLSKKPCWGSSVAHSSTALQLDVSPPPTAVVVQHPSSLPPAGVPPGSPSSTHVGGDQLGITTEELEAFLASSSSSVDVGGEQNCTGGDAFFTTEVEASPFDLLSMPSLEQVRAFLMSDDTFDLAAAGM